MKILWLTNYPLPVVAKNILNLSIVNEGWLNLLSVKLSNEPGWELINCFAIPEIQQRVEGREENIRYYGIVDEKPNVFNIQLNGEFIKILKKEEPDIIHIMGSEFPHSFSMFEASEAIGYENRCVLSIQGLISEIAKAYDLEIPENKKKRRILWDWYTHDSILCGKNDFIDRGRYECMLLKKMKYVIGRTDWDFMNAKRINPNITYFKVNEILRSSFYKSRWNFQQCEKYTIMIGQATYPVKGFHILLEALVVLKRKYSQIKLFVPSATVYPKAMKRWRIFNSDYTNYICDLIKDNYLQENIIFLGQQDEEQMLKTYLKSNVFVVSSTIENSCNALCEAMLLGMPVISSEVGGLGSLMKHKEEGLFYPLYDKNLLAEYIEYVFENPAAALEMGKNAHEKAAAINSIQVNLNAQIECYNKIFSNIKSGK